jgi:hypothetical protein
MAYLAGENEVDRPDSTDQNGAELKVQATILLRALLSDRNYKHRETVMSRERSLTFFSALG